MLAFIPWEISRLEFEKYARRRFPLLRGKFKFKIYLLAANIGTMMRQRSPFSLWKFLTGIILRLIVLFYDIANMYLNMYVNIRTLFFICLSVNLNFKNLRKISTTAAIRMLRHWVKFWNQHSGSSSSKFKPSPTFALESYFRKGTPS